MPQSGDNRNASVTLHLRSIDELFVAPAMDPLNGQFEEQSGFDRIVRQLRRFEGTESGNLTIVLPSDQVETGLEPRIRQAIAGVCASRIDDLGEAKRAVRLLGNRELRFGLLILAVSLFLAGIIDSSSRTDGFFTHVLVEGLVIVGWISLWHPVDLLIFERWPLERDRRVLTQMQGMTVSVEADQGTRPDPTE